jgi:hypothetical protein
MLFLSVSSIFFKMMMLKLEKGLIMLFLDNFWQNMYYRIFKKESS